MSFKLTQICISIKTFCCRKDESALILSNLPLLLFFRECATVKIFNPSATKKVAKKNLFSDIAKINTVVNFFNNSYAMYIVELKTFKIPVKEYQNMQKALRLRKNTFLLFAFVSLLSKNNFLLDLRSLILSRIWFQS